ncbi:MAG: hypothetical protein QXE31_02170 [Candidatus Woesearchaeota archaeon]
MKIKNLNKHDKYLLELYDKIKDDYDSLSTNVKIIKKKRLIGEVDILARKGNEYYIYEVKCSYRITKAKKQAKQIKKHLKDLSIKGVFFYCGISGCIICI